MVFCEAKVKINLTMVREAGANKLFEVAMGSKFVTHSNLRKIAKQSGLDLDTPLNAIKNTFLSNFPGITNEKNLPSTERAKLNQKLTETARYHIMQWDKKEQTFYNAYQNYFEEKLQLNYHLLPMDEYKNVGRDLIAIGDYLEEWERVSLMCVISARMNQLRSSKTERSLFTALVPACIAECSEEDSLWGYVMTETKTGKITWLGQSTNSTTLDNGDRLFQIIDDATQFQNRYIHHLEECISAGKYKDAYNFLFERDSNVNKLIRGVLPGELSILQEFDLNSVHKLGLSERLIQALWTKQITFPLELINLISDRLNKYNIGYKHIIPELRVDSNTSALQILSTIGDSNP